MEKANESKNELTTTSEIKNETASKAISADPNSHLKKGTFNKGYTLVPEINGWKTRDIKNNGNPNSPLTNSPFFNHFNDQENLAFNSRFPYQPQVNTPRKYNDNYSRKPFFPLNTLSNVQKQIEYYFSDENLFKDKFVKSKMDKNGFVDVDVIADFPRMKNSNIISEYIIKSAKRSPYIEVVGQFLRSADSWWKFIEDDYEIKPEENVENSKPEFMSEEKYKEIKLKIDAGECDEDEDDQTDFDKLLPGLKEQNLFQQETPKLGSPNYYYYPQYSPNAPYDQGFYNAANMQFGMEQMPYSSSFASLSATTWDYDTATLSYQSPYPVYRKYSDGQIQPEEFYANYNSQQASRRGNSWRRGGWRGGRRARGGKKSSYGNRKEEQLDVNEHKFQREDINDFEKFVEKGKTERTEELNVPIEEKISEKLITDTVSKLAKDLEDAVISAPDEVESDSNKSEKM